MSVLHNMIGLLFAQPHHKVQGVRHPFFRILFIVVQYEMPFLLEEHVLLDGFFVDAFDDGGVGYQIER